MHVLSGEKARAQADDQPSIVNDGSGVSFGQDGVYDDIGLNRSHRDLVRVNENRNEGRRPDPIELIDGRDSHRGDPFNRLGPFMDGFAEADGTSYS